MKNICLWKICGNWGYFNTSGNDDNREIKFNDAKFYSDITYYPSEVVINKLKNFLKLIRNDL